GAHGDSRKRRAGGSRPCLDRESRRGPSKAVCPGSYGKITQFRPARSRQPSRSCSRFQHPPHTAAVRLPRTAGRALPADAEVADEVGHLPRGPARIFKATVWSMQGLRAAWLHESSFRLEVYLFVLLAPLA